MEVINSYTKKIQKLHNYRSNHELLRFIVFIHLIGQNIRKLAIPVMAVTCHPRVGLVEKFLYVS